MRGGVVVTGASTGIGRATARRLLAAGFAVWGSVRRTEDAAALRAEGVTPLMLDVTDAASIAAARAACLAQLGERPLVGLVNNAGIPAAGPLEFLPLEELRAVLEVNVIGLLAVTQAFLPALRRARGRIVNVGSVSGRIALPFAGPYAASKFAVEALSDSLRRELASSGVAVTLIEPGPVRTPIWARVVAAERFERYRETPYAALLPFVRRQALESGQRGLAPETVADVVLKALTGKRPSIRVVVTQHRLRHRVMRLLPDWVLDRAAQYVLSRA
jgi:NAD(P)-dependent dehydrogenase (short-subunit alcohol dehydrogenase family)